jgi:hypothetical protein
MCTEPPKTKTCKVCKTEKDISEFYKSIRKLKNTIEYSTKCKLCFANTRIRNEEYDKAYYSNNKDRIKMRGKKYRENNKETIKQRKKDYYEQNKNEILKRCSLIYATDENARILKIQREKARYAKESDKIKARIKKHRTDNKEIYNAKLKKRRKEDISFGLKHLVSTSIRNHLRKRSANKKGSISKYLPYSFDDLKQHLERQFEPWMTWNNHGVYAVNEWDNNDPSTWRWNIDHIIPHSTFHYISMEDEDFKKCWALENLRPLSAKQNVIDNDRC